MWEYHLFLLVPFLRFICLRKGIIFIMTREEFLERIDKVHGEKYTFIDLPSCINSKTTKVRAVCPIHGEFQVNARQMYRGGGCPLCGYARKGHTYTRDEYINRAMEVHGGKYSYDNLVYDGHNSDVSVTCKKHGEFVINARYHLRGGKCPSCARELRGVNQRYSYSYVTEKLYEMYGDEFKILTEEKDYVDTYQKIKVLHKKCGAILDKSLHDLFRGRCCKSCTMENTIKKIAKTNTEPFSNVKSRVDKMYKGEYSLLTKEADYVNTRGRVVVMHNSCGTVWNPIMNSILTSTTSCPCCRQSSLEAEISSFLKSNNIDFTPQKHFSWLGLQTLDFYLPKYNIGIECQGGQHFKVVDHFGGEEGFKQRKELDERKRKLCDENGVNLLYYSNLGIDYPYYVIESKDELLESIKKFS